MRFVFLSAALLAATAAAQTPSAAPDWPPVSAQCLAGVDESAHLMTAGEVCESGELSQAYRAAGLVRMHRTRQQCGGQLDEKHPQLQAHWRRHPAFALDDPAQRSESDIRAYCQAHRSTAAAIFRRYAPTLQQDIRTIWQEAWREAR